MTNGQNVKDSWSWRCRHLARDCRDAAERVHPRGFADRLQIGRMPKPVSDDGDHEGKPVFLLWTDNTVKW